MKNAINTIRQLRPATVMAILALFVAIGGTATAASGLINGKKLKNNTVAGKKLKNKTVTMKKLAPKTVNALKGQQGPQGPKGTQGAKGEQGPKGDPGQDGVVAPVYETFGNLNIPANLEMAIGSVNVPAGKYMVTATFNVTSNASNNVSCGISTNNGGGQHTAVFDPNGGGRTTLPSQLVTETSTVSQVTLGCHSGDQITGASGSVIVTPVS